MFSFSFSNQEMHNVCHNKFDRQRTFLVPAETVETISLQCLGNFQILYWIFGIPSVFVAWFTRVLLNFYFEVFRIVQFVWNISEQYVLHLLLQ